MTVNNFNWYLHALLFLHTERVIRRQREKLQREMKEDEDEDDVDEDLGVEIEREE